jgi:hypothetical protein
VLTDGAVAWGIDTEGTVPAGVGSEGVDSEGVDSGGAETVGVPAGGTVACGTLTDGVVSDPGDGRIWAADAIAAARTSANPTVAVMRRAHVPARRDPDLDRTLFPNCPSAAFVTHSSLNRIESAPTADVGAA